MTGKEESVLLKNLDAMDRAAARLGLCTPSCRVVSLSDTTSCGLRTIVALCSDHGEKFHSFTVAGGMTGSLPQ